MPTSADQRFFEFGGFYLDTVERRLLGADNEPIPLSSRAVDVLIYLVQYPREIIDKGRLMAAGWPNTIVEENNLNQAIAALRRALDETHGEHRFILTIPGRGYRFIAEVKALEALPGLVIAELTHESAAANLPETGAATAPDITNGKAGHWNKPAPLILGALLIIVLSYLFWHRTPPEKISEGKLSQAVTPTIPPAPAPDKSVIVVPAPLQSVAVLPFTDMSPDKDQEYFADGVAEEVLNQLSQIQDLFVVGRTSSFSFKGKDEDLRVIGEKLGVSHLLEGSVRKEGNRVRVSAQLVKAADGYHLWSQTYDRTLEDIFAVQEDISTAVAQALQVSLGLGEFSRPGWTRNVAAYEEFLLGISYQQKVTPQSLPRAVEHYQRAIAIDPSFILARTALVYTFGFSYLLPDRVSERRKQAEQVYDEARRLAPEHPVVLLLGAGEGLGPEEYWIERERVVKLMQGAVPYWDNTYGLFLNQTGRAREALTYLERARQNDPLAGGIAINLAEAYANTGNIQASREELERAATLPNTPQWVVTANALVTAMAVNDLQAIYTLTQMPLGNNEVSRAIYREMGPLAGDQPALRAALRRVWSDPANRTLSGSLMITGWSAYAGDPELALEALNAVADVNTYNTATLWTSLDADMIHRPLWRPLLRDVRRLPGFKDLVRKLGLVSYWRTTGTWGDFCRPLGEDDFECE